MDSYFSRTNVVAAAATISFLALLGTMFFHRKSRSHQEDKTMPSSSSSSLTLLSPPSSSPHIWIHHVFPSFHGADVRTNFLSHVLKELRSKGIDLFIDNDIERSKSIGPALIQAIKGSRIAIVFLSKNYASSTWCLNELVEIIKCREEFGQTVISLFYKVDPTDVKKQTGDFGKVFEETCVGKTKEEIRRWKHALTEVAQIAGFHSSNWETEAKMIEVFATDVSNKLNNFAPSSDFNGLIGMESHITEMGPLLQLHSNEVRKIGILGPLGIGKTTIARFLFNQHSQDFQLSVFMDNIRRNYSTACSDDYSVKLDLQKKFMSQLTNETCIKVPHLGVVKDRLKDKKVLVVFDDVDQLIQLEAMAKETCWFGPGSRIIITTQNQKILKASGINHIYNVDLPSNDEALQMFCMYAFGQKDPKDDLRELAFEVRSLVGRLPLGLRVMGSYFRGMSEQDWIDTLTRLRKHLDRDGEIASILEFSYDALRDEDKSLFLHIACFFHFEKVNIVEDCLEKCYLDVRHGLHVLAEKSLISMDSGRTNMSNLLIQLGRKIMREQSDREPGNYQLLNDAIDVGEVLIDDKAGSSSVIGRDLYEKTTCASERDFIRLSNLQFLRTKRSGVNLQSMNNISRKLSWPMFQMTCFPSSFNPTFQVKLEMPFSKLEKLWGETDPLNLKWIELSYSYYLNELPDLSTATNLYELDLTDSSSLDLIHYSSLVKLSSSIGNAIKLQNLNLSHCSDLVEIPSSIITNLKSHDIYGYSSLVEVPFNIEKVMDSIYINLSYCSSMVEVPSSIENAINIQELNLNDCSSPVEIPFSIGNAFYLQKLNMSYCSRLVKLPSSTGNIVNIEEEDLDHCSGLVERPSPVSNLGRLSELELKECSQLEVLLASINLESLGEVNLSDFSLLKSYPESSKDVQENDPWIERISGLRKLVQSGMEKLESLPQLPDSLWAVDADDGDESLERLGSSFSNPDINLSFLNYFKLNQEEKDIIMQTPSNEYEAFPGREVPQCFTYRSSGSSVTVKLNQKPIDTSTKFKACIVSASEDKKGFREWERASVCCSITTSRGIALCSFLNIIEQFLPGNLYTFEFEVETEEFEVDYADLIKKGKTLEVKECGVMLVNVIESFGDDNSSGALDGARGSADPYQLLYFI
ncbi:disease resistance protein TAO1-like [Raphanus sativus]|uniref:ADP-ribosyl cyclase/cyclic ADP-ribose hydrolase n=1 Tax=Raphanus sativus TaxID=3726 RepID=A0A9W3CS43_RAPSA|nr:disease resistance protein TAO1-like [Raphanus sativus]